MSYHDIGRFILVWKPSSDCNSSDRDPNEKDDDDDKNLQIPWDNNHDALAKWANATTGFPWIDAIMTQLREEVEMIFYNRSH